MAQASNGRRHRIRIALAALILLGACQQTRKEDSAEREFNDWANQVDQAAANGQQAAPADLEEPANILARVVPARAR